MNKLLPFDTLKLSSKVQTLFLLFFLALLGTHYFDYQLYLFIFAGLFLVNWHFVTNKNFLLVFLFILSIYVTWSFLDPRILYEVHLRIEIFSQGLLILLMYLLGFSICTNQHHKLLVSNKSVFYILFIFIISYSFVVFWSYATIKQDSPLSTYGMFVSFPNPYQRAHVNGGRLISTILTYYLTLMSFLLPLILFYFTRLKKQGFYLLELFLLILLSIFVLYITAMMGRRTVFVLFTLILLLSLLIWVITHSKGGKYFLLIGLLITVIIYSVFYFLTHQEDNSEIKAMIVTENMIIPIVEHPKTIQEKIDDIPLYQKLMAKGISDHRFIWWSTALNVMMDYPFGGGNGIYLEKGMRLAHNTWIDIGKDLGIIPFTFFIIISSLHIYYLIQIILSRDVEALLKYQLIIISIGVFAIMMIEPVFTSDKTFFAYIFFYFGILGRVHLEVANKKNE